MANLQRCIDLHKVRAIRTSCGSQETGEFLRRRGWTIGEAAEALPSAPFREIERNRTEFDSGSINQFD